MRQFVILAYVERAQHLERISIPSDAFYVRFWNSRLPATGVGWKNKWLQALRTGHFHWFDLMSAKFTVIYIAISASLRILSYFKFKSSFWDRAPQFDVNTARNWIRWHRSVFPQAIPKFQNWSVGWTDVIAVRPFLLTSWCNSERFFAPTPVEPQLSKFRALWKIWPMLSHPPHPTPSMLWVFFPVTNVRAFSPLNSFVILKQ